MCVYPQDLEIDGTRDGEGEGVIVRDRVSAWVYTHRVYQRELSLICIHYRPTAATHTEPSPPPPPPPPPAACPQGAAAAITQKEETPGLLC